MPALQISFLSVLRSKWIRRLAGAQVISTFGDALAMLAVFGLVTFQLHGTAAQAAMILVAYFAPLAVVGPLSGVYIDRWNVKWAMILSDVIRGFLVLGLVFVRDLTAICFIFFALSTVSSFFVPAQTVVLKTLAPAGGLLAVNALMTQANSGIAIIAPSVAGLLVQWFGASSCFLLDSVSFFISATLVMTIRIKPERTECGRSVESVWAAMRAGTSFILKNRTVSLVVLAMSIGMFAVRCFGSLLSLYVRDVLHSDVALFGTLNTLIGVGLIVGTQLVHRCASKVAEQYMVVSGLAVMGLGVLLTALFSTVATTAAGMLSLGLGAACIIAPTQTLVQRETPPAMLGRVSSSRMSLFALSQVIAMLVAGPIAERMGLKTLYLGSSFLLVSAGIVGLFKLRAVSRAQELY
ncbi:MAG TPA: MFS transporter [Bryobacteraceae bacterium]|nr:MFS transporter [Bryobacteraceae bacterium]